MEYEYAIRLNLANVRAVFIDHPTHSDFTTRKDAVTLRTDYRTVECVIGSGGHSV